MQIRDLYTYDLSALRADAEHKRHTLTSLRLEVSEGPTVSCKCLRLLLHDCCVGLANVIFFSDSGHCWSAGHHCHTGVRHTHTAEQVPGGEDARLAPSRLEIWFSKSQILCESVRSQSHEQEGMWAGPGHTIPAGVTVSSISAGLACL